MKQQRLVSWLLLAPVFSLGDDGFGGLTATGPQFQKSASLAGLRKTGATTYVVGKKDFTPAEDVRLLIVSGS